MRIPSIRYLPGASSFARSCKIRTTYYTSRTIAAICSTNILFGLFYIMVWVFIRQAYLLRSAICIPGKIHAAKVVTCYLVDLLTKQLFLQIFTRMGSVFVSHTEKKWRESTILCVLACSLTFERELSKWRLAQTVHPVRDFKRTKDGARSWQENSFKSRKLLTPSRIPHASPLPNSLFSSFVPRVCSLACGILCSALQSIHVYDEHDRKQTLSLYKSDPVCPAS